MRTGQGQKKIAVIEDMCGYGRCSLTVALPIISAFGIQACPVPTAIFSNHTAFPEHYRTDYTEYMAEYVKPWQKMDLRFDGILSGYLANVGQVRHVMDIIEEFASSDCTVVVDPVMGDEGVIYQCVDSNMKDMMRKLISRADAITPNVTEACALTETEYDAAMSVEKAKELAYRLKDMGPESIVITGLCMGSEIGNLCLIGNEISVIKTHKAGANRCGTGDAFAATVTALLVTGKTMAEAVDAASHFIANAIVKSDELGIDKRNGIAFEAFMSIKV